MCTVSFLPTGGNNFILTSNRDEKDTRERALPPRIFSHNHLNVCYPQDPRAKGTWIAVSENNFTLCLLNGGFVPHKSRPPYRKSRGVMLLDFFNFNNVNQFVVNYDFKGIEPFTLIIAEYRSILKLYELRWDGKQIHLSYRDAKQSAIWSSVTLYTPEVIKTRESWFNAWKQKQKEGFFPENISEFHMTGGTGDKSSDLLMRRPGTGTVSVTQVIKNGTETEMRYNDCLSNQAFSVAISAT
jgi:uncharacterized protein with NRDE domain